MKTDAMPFFSACFCVVALLCASSCLHAAAQGLWVEIEYQSQTSEENYFIFGQMDAAVYDSLVKPDPKFLFLRIRNCRYWNEETEQYAAFEDEEDSGEVTIAMRSVVQIVRKKGDPLQAQKVKVAPNDIP